MYRSLIIILGLAMVSPSGLAASAISADYAAASFENKLKVSKSFWIYFLNRTEDYSLSVEQFVSLSSARVYRGCGANCAYVLRDLVNQLRASQPAECIEGPGLQNVILRLSSGDNIVYSHGGRLINFQGLCYLSDKSVNVLLDNTDYIFR